MGLWLGLSLVGAASAGSVAFVLYDFRRGSADTLVTTLIAVLTTTAGAVRWLWRRAGLTRAARLPLERAADELAEQLRQQWERAAAERGLTYPAPLPVRWHWSPQQVTGPRADAVGGQFAPLPGMAAITVKDLRSGAVPDLLGLYGGLSSGRLIVLGEPGAGKSAAGIRLLLDALAHRASVTTTDRVPVPVLVTPQGWDPVAEPFAEWLATRLARDYSLLRAPEYGADAAAGLIEGGHLTVILDGLDELPEVQRPVALRALDAQVTCRLVVLTRTKELVAAVSGAHLRGAAALELLPINARQAARYLASTQIDPPPASWRKVIDHLREHPDGVLAQALATPLMLTVLRDTYGPEQGVDELIDASRFGSAQAIEDHLLDRVLPAAYTRHPGQAAPPYTVEQAQRWLAQLARRMNAAGTRDLAWWHIPRWVPVWPRAVATVAVMSLACAFLAGSLGGLASHIQLVSAWGFGHLTALAAVFCRTLAYGFIVGFGLLVMSPPRGGSRPQRSRLRWSGTDVRRILLLGLGAGVATGAELGFEAGPQVGFGLDLGIGLMSSFTIGLGFVLSGGPPQRLGWLRWSGTDTRGNIRTGLVVGITVGITVGVKNGLAYGLNYAFAPGFIIGIGFMLVIAFGGQPSLRQNRLPGSGSGTPTILLIGLIIAIEGAPGYGVIYILIGILGGRSPLQQGRLRWSRTVTPTTILTGLVVGIALGLADGLVLGLMPGLEFGIVFGLTGGLLLGLSQPSTEATGPLDSRSLWRRESQLGLMVGLVVSLVVGLGLGLVQGRAYGLAVGIAYGIPEGIVAGLGSGLVSSATWATALASAQLWRRGEAPVRLLRFLDDARERQILRTVGPAYQFRHARLQDRLARKDQAMPEMARAQSS
ncbi:MAG: NACHT domain-containing protein [Pseudonocardiaceae bacterium]